MYYSVSHKLCHLNDCILVYFCICSFYRRYTVLYIWLQKLHACKYLFWEFYAFLILQFWEYFMHYITTRVDLYIQLINVKVRNEILTFLSNYFEKLTRNGELMLWQQNELSNFDFNGPKFTSNIWLKDWVIKISPQKCIRSTNFSLVLRTLVNYMADKTLIKFVAVDHNLQVLLRNTASDMFVPLLIMTSQT